MMTICIMGRVPTCSDGVTTKLAYIYTFIYKYIFPYIYSLYTHVKNTAYTHIHIYSIHTHTHTLA